MSTTDSPKCKFTPILPWRVLLPLATLGLLWPHFDYVMVFVGFTFFLILLMIALAFIVLVVVGGIGLWNGDKNYQRRSLQGFLVLTIIFTAPVVSSKTVDAYFRYRADKLINELDAYRNEHGSFPDTLTDGVSISTIHGLEYVKLTGVDEYILKYENAGLILNKFNSSERQWSKYGWND